MYENSAAVEGKVCQETVRIWGPNTRLVVLKHFAMAPSCLSCDKKFIFLSQRRNTNIANIL
jgi:hypothetical protein